jgi:FkbM family methyltransferase
MKTFIQIGTNDGNDEFNSIVKVENPDLIILVEPNSELNNDIKKNYSEFIDKVFIENVAINTKSGPCEVVLSKKYFPELNDYMYTNHTLYTLLPMDSWGDDFVSLKIDGITFNELCEKYSITEIDFLQIDTEGFDSQIILSIDFDKIKIKKLKYEIWGFTPDCYSRYGEKSKDYGTNGMKNVEEKLISLGYKLTQCTTDIEAVLVN